MKYENADPVDTFVKAHRRFPALRSLSLSGWHNSGILEVMAEGGMPVLETLSISVSVPADDCAELGDVLGGRMLPKLCSLELISCHFSSDEYKRVIDGLARRPRGHGRGGAIDHPTITSETRGCGHAISPPDPDA